MAEIPGNLVEWRQYLSDDDEGMSLEEQEALLDRCINSEMTAEARIRELEQEREQFKSRENAARFVLWGGHGHAGIYGDDGEMQCSRCIPWDYKRAPFSEVLAAAILALQAQLQAVTQERDVLAEELSRHAAIYERLGAQLQARNQALRDGFARIIASSSVATGETDWALSVAYEMLAEAQEQP